MKITDEKIEIHNFLKKKLFDATISQWEDITIKI